MIPKTIHYCWFGRGEIPARLGKCMKSWESILGGYTFMRWDEDSFDVESTPWTKEAYEAKKYAFVSDYARLIALEKYGGVYLDTDVLVKKPFDPFLDYRGFTGFEKDDAVTSAVVGCEAHFPLIREFISYYHDRHFLDENGGANKEANVVMMTKILLKHGLKLDDSEQIVADMHIFPRTYFCPLDFYHNDGSTDKTVAVHYFDASWLDEDTKRMVERERTLFHKKYIQVKSLVKDFLKR